MTIIGVGVTTKSVALGEDKQLSVTEIFPVVAPEGTVVVMVVAELVITVASVPLNVTMLFVGVKSNPVPVMVTGDPTGPEAGEKERTTGGGDAGVYNSETSQEDNALL